MASRVYDEETNDLDIPTLLSPFKDGKAGVMINGM
jgi:hypothetical protein